MTTTHEHRPYFLSPRFAARFVGWMLSAMGISGFIVDAEVQQRRAGPARLGDRHKPSGADAAESADPKANDQWRIE
jgi:hypothetical protein